MEEYKMKKIMAMLLVLTLSGAVLAGCSTPNETPEDTTPPTQTEQPSENEAVEGEMAKIGLGTITSIAKSKSLEGETAPLGQVDTTMAAVGFDAEGRVVKVTIDVAQTKVNFDADLQLTTNKEDEFKTKVEKGDEYGMKKASGIEKEWYEQAAALEEWMVGKTVEEITSMEVDEEAVPTEAELTSSVTIGVDAYIAAVEEAFNNAVEVEAGAVKLGLGTAISIAKSKSGEGETTPLAQVDTTMTVTAFDADGKVAGTIIDVAQTKVAFDAEGQLTTDKDAEFKTKVELGDDYGMKKASGIEKEWYEQAAALEEWMVGKTVEEITSMEVDEEGNTTDAELTSSVTVGVDAYIAVVEEAATNAK